MTANDLYCSVRRLYRYNAVYKYPRKSICYGFTMCKLIYKEKHGALTLFNGWCFFVIFFFYYFTRTNIIIIDNKTIPIVNLRPL